MSGATSHDTQGAIVVFGSVHTDAVSVETNGADAITFELDQLLVDDTSMPDNCDQED